MTSLNKAALAAIIVERSRFYGSRSIKKINKWFNKNHNEITGLKSKHGARVVVGKAVHELAKYKAERIKSLMRLSKADLERMIKHKSAIELERYGGGSKISEKDLPPIELKEQRQVIISRKDLQDWQKQSRKHSRRKTQPETLPVKKAAPVKRKRMTRRTALKVTQNWISNMTKFNNSMASTYNVAGIQG
jgi:hypothetical protein